MSEPFKVISQHDPAIDRKKSKLDLYRKTLAMEHLVFLDRKPIVFEVRDLSYEDWHEALLFVNQPGMAADRAFRAGIVSVQGATKLCDGGAWRPTHERVRDGVATLTVTAADMREIFAAIAPKHILDVGGLLLERAEMEREGNGAGGVG